MGRAFRTHLSTLHPKDREHPAPPLTANSPFSQGQTVWALKHQRNGSVWVPGLVTFTRGCRSCDITLHDGRRMENVYVDHMRRRSPPADQPEPRAETPEARADAPVFRAPPPSPSYEQDAGQLRPRTAPPPMPDLMTDEPPESAGHDLPAPAEPAASSAHSLKQPNREVPEDYICPFPYCEHCFDRLAAGTRDEQPAPLGLTHPKSPPQDLQSCRGASPQPPKGARGTWAQPRLTPAAGSASLPGSNPAGLTNLPCTKKPRQSPRAGDGATQEFSKRCLHASQCKPGQVESSSQTASIQSDPCFL